MEIIKTTSDEILMFLLKCTAGYQRTMIKNKIKVFEKYDSLVVLPNQLKVAQTVTILRSLYTGVYVIHTGEITSMFDMYSNDIDPSDDGFCDNFIVDFELSAVSGCFFSNHLLFFDRGQAQEFYKENHGKVVRMDC